MNKKERAEDKIFVKAINKIIPNLSWVPCIVCEGLCPQSYEDEFFSQFDEVHSSCITDPIYPRRVKALETEREAANKPSLF